jgi:hypothetical protein
MNPKAWIVAAACLTAGMAQATCYTVYKADGSVLQESSTPPVNLVLPIGDSVPLKFGAGTTMIVSDHSVYCKDRSGAQLDDASPRSVAAVAQAETKKAEAMVIKEPAQNTAAR